MKTAVIITAALLVMLLLLWLYLIAPRFRRPAVLRELRAQKYAHRGLHSRAGGVPENSLAAFRLARDRGYAIELDVHLSRDGRLVVEHDDALTRTCGTALTIETADWQALAPLCLEGTAERLPLLEEVLQLINGRVPLLIELKVVNHNHNALAAAVHRALQTYEGLYCIESFDPRALLWFRRHAPGVVRGQLAAYVRRDGAPVPRSIDFMLRNLLVNVISRPDFVAYNYRDCKNLSVRVSRLLRTPFFFWTVCTPDAEALAARHHAAPIFEQIEV